MRVLILVGVSRCSSDKINGDQNDLLKREREVNRCLYYICKKKKKGYKLYFLPFVF